MDQSLSSVMKSISLALKMDAESNYEEAYIKYLESIQSVITSLLSILQHNGGLVVVNDSVKKYVKIGLQCMERVSAVLEQIGKQTNNNGTSSLSSPQLHVESELKATENISISTSMVHHSNTSIPDQEVERVKSEKENSNLFSAPVPPLPPPHASHLYVKPTELSPLDMAYKRNEQMLKAYKARLARMNAGKGKASVTTMSLSIQRKLAENLAIAKVKEEALAKKMKERQQRLESEAARRFTMPIGLSKEEKEQRQLYKKILDYEHDVQWLQVWRQKIECNPKDPILINQLIQEILRCLDHPLTKLLSDYQTKIYERIYPLIIKKIPMIEEVKVPLPQHLFPYKDAAEEHSCLDALNQESEASLSTDNNNSITEDIVHSKSDQMNCSSQLNSLMESNGHHINHAPISNTSCYDEDTPSGFDSKALTDEHEDSINVFIKSKADLKDSMKKGEILQKSLEEENEKLKHLAVIVTQDSETYSVDNMDDLFDNSDSEDQDDFNSRQNITTLEHIINRDGNNDKMDKGCKKVDAVEEEKIQKLRVEAIERHLKTVSLDVNNFLEKLIVMFTISYEQLNSPGGRDQCYAALEEAFFKPLWKYILYIYRLASRNKEVALAYVMTKALDISPADMGIRETLLHTNPVNNEVTPYLPYQEVIDEVGNLTHHYTLLNKLECIVKISKQICHCVETYYKESHSGSSDHMPSVGADDLLPILTYVIIKSKCPQIVAECQAMMEFIHEGYLMGEEGYCLTSLQTAINYLVSTSEKW